MDFSHYLSEIGLITNNQLEIINNLCESNHKKVGEILLSECYLEKNQLISLLKEYTSKKG